MLDLFTSTLMPRAASVPALLAVLASCAPRMQPYTPSHHTVTADPNVVYAAAVRVFVRAGWGLQSRDPVARVVETDFQDIDGGQTRLSYRIVVNPGGFELFTSCLYDSPTDLRYRYYTACPGRPARVAFDEANLAESIRQELLVLTPDATASASSPVTASSGGNASAEPRRGDLGESCTRTDDCAPPLRCVRLVCTAPRR